MKTPDFSDGATWTRIMVLSAFGLIVFAFFLSLTGCRRHIHHNTETTIVEDTMGFDFVRDINGATLSSSYWIGDAALVVPPDILAATPADDDPREGVILYLGDADEFYSYYLLSMRAGSYCIVDRDEHEILGVLDFVEDGHLVVVELSTLEALGLLSEVVGAGTAVELAEPVAIDAARTELRIGSVRIRLYGRD